MNNTQKILLVVFAVAMGSLSLGMVSVSAMNDTTVQDSDRIVKSDIIDEIGEKTILLVIENQELQDKTDEKSVEKYMENKLLIAQYHQEMRDAVPKVERVGISDELMKEMKILQSDLRGSDLPIYLTGPNTKTGEFDIYIHSAEPIVGMTEKLKSINPNVPINVIYKESNSRLQLGSCDANGVFCDPIVGGSDGKDKYNGKSCTVSIGAQKGNNAGIVIPKHCDPNNSDYHQSLTGSASHKVGNNMASGWWYCDCEFVKSDSRTVSQNKVTLGSSDYTISGKSDFSVGDIVFLYGAISGWQWGTVQSIGNEWTPYGSSVTFSDLYIISGISYQSGDSGAPAIDYYDGNYGGMNIGSENTDMQMVHEWSHIKWNLGLS